LGGSVFGQALALAVTPDTLLAIVAAAAFGVFMGGVPGLTATLAIALIAPMTFFMEPMPAVAAMVAVTATAIFAGDIPGALMRTPGTPASAAYVEDTFAMTRRGHLRRALSLGLAASVVGGVIGVVALSAGAPLLARLAARFSSVEYFWLACLGLTSATLVAGDDRIRAAIALLIGLLVATVGIDVTSGHPRFTFGITALLGGVSFIPAMMGLFAAPALVRALAARDPAPPAPEGAGGRNGRGGTGPVWGRVFARPVALLRSGALGVGVGALPGAGADIAAWISYAVSRRFSRRPERYGKGSEEGLADATAANNAAMSGTWVPTLVFGIPGDSATAVVLGVLLLKGIEPGPTIFIHTPEVVYAIFMIFLMANLVLWPVGLAAIRAAGLLARAPRAQLAPLVLVMMAVGAYAVDNSMAGIVVLMAFGLLGWGLEAFRFPLAPVILGMVLGRVLEEKFLQTMMKSGGDPLIFVERPIAAGLAVATVAIWGVMAVRMVRPRTGRRAGAGPDAP